MLIAAWLIAAVLFFWGLGAYNRLMRLRNGITAAWLQLEGPLRGMAETGQQLAESGPAWLPAEGSAFEALRAASAELQTAAHAVGSKPFVADPVGQLAVASALQGSALQRVKALLELHARDDDTQRRTLLTALKAAEQQRDFGRQLFNQRVLAFNAALSEWPTRVLAGLYGFHDAGKL